MVAFYPLRHIGLEQNDPARRSAAIPLPLVHPTIMGPSLACATALADAEAGASPLRTGGLFVTAQNMGRLKPLGRLGSSGTPRL